ncbi:hypothetical protein GYMLUDRAFT_981797 [Collybiopsis luxurians FD-317 M1]|nr:hypothetical protein GYMLUDRAFT_981797 [Collybiopsis luxurians FD-317 M1]
MIFSLLLTSVLSALYCTQAAAFNFDSACSSIASQVSSIENATVFHTDLVPAGTNLTFPDQDPSCSSRSSQVVPVDICRVTLNVSTSDSSGIFMEAWLPKNWTGRFLSTGNGGFGGCIQYEDLAYSISLGFATVGANNGHNGTSGSAFVNREVLADFVYRSLHTNVVVGKEITKKFYGTPHNTSYYLGCSTGGRQGWKMVQDFPDDFDGVVAGSPVINWNNLENWGSHFHDILGNANSPTFITSDQWLGLIHENILKQCDTIDGVADGIIEDPNLENAVYINASYGPNIWEFGPDWWHFVVFTPSFDLNTLNLTDYEFAENLDPFNISTFKGDLSPFQARGGKVITYHGQADMLIGPTDTEYYYQHVSQTMGLPPVEIDKFMRFFRISGMSHCSTGPGAWEFGQTLAAASGNLTAETLDPERNVLTAMVRWVEEGVAPDTILGTKYVNDTPSLGVQFSRKHCRYPFRNTYNGTGDSTLPDSWSCQ